MIISDLNYLEVVAEETGVVGGTTKKYYADKLYKTDIKVVVKDSPVTQTATGGKVDIDIEKASLFSISATADAINSITVEL